MSLPDAAFGVPLGLLNVSPYLPNQIFFALSCFAIFAAVRLWTLLKPQHPWDGPFRMLALVNLWMALTIALFTVSGLLDPLKRWQPTVHMLEEIGTMGAFSYLAWKVNDLLPGAATRGWLRVVLKAAPLVFAACWVAAATIGWRHPFPMTGLFVDLPPEAFAYRALLLAPGLFYTGLISVLFFRDYRLAKTVGADPSYVRRLGYFSLGSLSFFVSCADHTAWAYLQVHGPERLERTLAAPQVVVEALLWMLMGLLWILGILAPYGRGRTDLDLEEHRRFLRRIRALKTDLLVNLPQTVAHRRRTAGYLRAAARALDLAPHNAARGEKVFELVAARSTGATTLGERELLDLAELYDSLLHHLPPDSPERRNLTADPLPPALEPAAIAVGHLPDRRPEDLGRAAPWAQLAYLAASDLGLLRPNVAAHVHPNIARAYRDSKRQDSESAY